MSEKGSPEEQSLPPAGAGLERSLGLTATVVSGIGIIIGAGIYVIIGVAAASAGNAVWLSFLIAALGATLTGLSYARLARFRPRNAPEFQFLGMTFGPFPGFLAGWLILWAVMITAGTVSLGFAGYLEHLLGVPLLAGAVGLILVSSVIVFIGVGQSVIVAGVLTAVSVVGLLFIIGIGIPHLGDVDLLETPLGISGIVTAASLVFFAYIGFQGMANFSDEMKNPGRNLPRAILLAVLVTTVLYVLVALAAVSAVGWRALSESAGAPLASVASSVLGSNAELFISILALASTANTVLLVLFAASRIMWAMSCEGALPKTFCVIGKERHSPWAAIGVVALVASLFAAIRNIEQAAEFTNFTTLIAFAAVNASAIKFFWKQGASGGAVRYTLNLFLPALGMVFAVWLAVGTGWLAALLGGAVIAVGAGIYPVIKRKVR